MPIYDYTCNNCQKSSTVLLLGTKDQAECPHCGSKDLKMDIPRGTTAILKGNGWYRDGYGKKKGRGSSNEQ